MAYWALKVCFALAAYGLGILPVNWFGLVFIAAAFVLFVLDIKAATHGALTATGVASFIVGALVLFNSPGTPQFQRVSLPLVIFVGIFIGVIFAVIVGFALRAQRRRVLTGQESLVSQTGVAVTLESAADLGSVLAARVEEGSPPDIAVLPGPALLQRYAQAGCLVPLRRALPVDKLAREYPEGWPELASAGGELYGLLYRLSNESIVWYSPAQFQERKWVIPLTWTEMVALGDRIARQGLTPWSLGLQERAAAGEEGTDWIENILLRSAGPEVYDRWVRHEIPWTDPAIRQAFLTWGQVVGRPRHLHGGPLAALRASGMQALGDLFQDIPAAYLHLQGSAAQPFIAHDFPRETAGRDYDFFSLPPMRLQDQAPVLAGAEILVLFNDSPQAEAMLRYLSSPQAQEIAMRQGGTVSPNREQDLQAYPDWLSRRAARQVTEAEALRFDASQQMPETVQGAFRDAVREFLVNPGRLSELLSGVEQAAREADLTAQARGQVQAAGDAPPLWLAPPAQPAWIGSLLKWPNRPQGAGAPTGAPLEGIPEGSPTK